MNNMIELPDDAVEVIRQMLDDADLNVWSVGEVIGELVAESRASIKAVCDRLAYELGRASSTLADYEYMARKVSREDRERYPVLTRHQWKACLGAGDDYLAVATWAVEEYPDRAGGRPAPVNAIWAYVYGGDEPAEQALLIERYRDRLMRVLLDGAHDTRLPGWLCDLYGRMAVEYQAFMSGETPVSSE